MKAKRKYKEWFLIYNDTVTLGIECGDKAAIAALKNYPGSRRRAYWTYEEARKALERGPDYAGHEPPPLF